jgi:4-hydroxy-4-methyl-2-oxoglutarate aldolase
VRDVGALEALGFPVFSATVALPGATKIARGAVGEPTTVAGVPVATGDWVVGDVDGVVVVPSGRLDATVTAGRKRASTEAGYFTALRAGSTTVELLDLDVSPIEVASTGE